MREMTPLGRKPNQFHIVMKLPQCLVLALVMAGCATLPKSDSKVALPGGSRGDPLPNSTWELIQAHRYADAYPTVVKLAQSSNQEAQFILANYYICGRVVAFSCTDALPLFKAATVPSIGDHSEEIVRRSKNEIAWINAACEERGLVRDIDLAMRYALEAAESDDPYSVDTVAAVQARNGDFKAATGTQRRAIEGLTAYARDNPVDSYTFDEFRVRLKLYEANQPASFGKWNADQNCNTLPNAAPH